MAYRKITNILLVIGLLSFGGHTGCKVGNSNLSGIPTDQITAIHPKGAFNFIDGRTKTHRESGDTSATCVSFNMKVAYPSNELVTFYREKLKSLNYVPYRNSKWTGGNFHWFSFADGTKKGTPCVQQFLMDWVDAKKSRIAMLAIYYESKPQDDRDCNFDPDNTLAHVALWSQPYSWRIK